MTGQHHILDYPRSINKNPPKKHTRTLEKGTTIQEPFDRNRTSAGESLRHTDLGTLHGPNRRRTGPTPRPTQMDPRRDVVVEHAEVVEVLYYGLGRERHDLVPVQGEEEELA